MSDKWIQLFLALPLIHFVTCYESCQVSEWSEWGECIGTRPCPSPRSHSQINTFSMIQAEWDSGRETMARIMEEKRSIAQRTDQCTRDGSCSELRSMPSDGYQPCDDTGNAGGIPCRNVDQLSLTNFADLGYTSDGWIRGSDIWGWTDPLDNQEYAIIGLSAGTSFVRISDPHNPVPLAYIPSHTGSSVWRDMKVKDNFVYIVADVPDHGMQVFNLERLRNMTSMHHVAPDVHYDKFGNCHNVVTLGDTDYLYCVGATQSGSPNYTICTGGLHTMDISDPLNPTFVECFGCDGYIHDAQCLIYNGPDTEFKGKELCFCYNEDSLTIMDVTEKHGMYIISKTGYEGSAYTHQGWLTDDHATLLLDDEADEMTNLAEKNTITYIWDVSNLREPRIRRRYKHSLTTVDHNQYIKDGLVYQANDEAGLRILRLLNDYDLQEVAYFDVYPTGNDVGFHGAWSVYPYFSSGNIIVSSREFGLFVVRPDYETIKKLGRTRGGSIYGEQTRTRKVLHKDFNTRCPNVVETKSCWVNC